MPSVRSSREKKKRSCNVRLIRQSYDALTNEYPEGSLAPPEQRGQLPPQAPLLAFVRVSEPLPRPSARVPRRYCSRGPRPTLCLSPIRALSRSSKSVNCDLERPMGGAGIGLGCVGENLESSTDDLRRSGWSAPRGGRSSSDGRARGVSKSKPPVTANLDMPTTLGDLKLAADVEPELILFDSEFDFDRAIEGAPLGLASLAAFRALAAFSSSGWSAGVSGPAGAW